MCTYFGKKNLLLNKFCIALELNKNLAIWAHRKLPNWIIQECTLKGVEGLGPIQQGYENFNNFCNKAWISNWLQLAIKPIDILRFGWTIVKLNFSGFIFNLPTVKIRVKIESEESCIGNVVVVFAVGVIDWFRLTKHERTMNERQRQKWVIRAASYIYHLLTFLTQFFGPVFCSTFSFTLLC